MKDKARFNFLLGQIKQVKSQLCLITQKFETVDTQGELSNHDIFKESLENLSQISNMIKELNQEHLNAKFMLVSDLNTLKAQM